MSEKLEDKLKELFIFSTKGNSEAYQSFLILSSTIVKKYLTYLGGRYESRETIEDLLQEILISIHQKKHTFQLEKPILPWIYAVARYRYIDFYRAKKRAPKSVELSEDLVIKTDEEPFISVEEIMEMLTPRQRDMLTLVKIEGESYAAAASTLNMSVPSLKVGIHRALKAIKAKVSK
ncbi:MAG: sigma-70 family RNA polymerase sigma factor [Bdellovibrionales bacterium]|nr:sigma-70 family RNA polymerase sigma factor [Bdellovibrionales bacterium]